MGKKLQEITKSKRVEEKSKIPDKHLEFIEFCKAEGVNSHQKAERPIGHITEDNVVLLDKSNPETFLLNRRFIYPEAIPFLFNLEGCSKKLFLFLLLFHVNNGNGEVLFNRDTLERFKLFCSMFSNNVYDDTTIKQAVKHLRRANILLSLNRGRNKINPLITSGTNEISRKRLIKEYSSELLEAKLDPYKDFYPKYISN